MTDKSLQLRYNEYEVKLYGECVDVFRAARLTSGNYSVDDLLFHWNKRTLFIGSPLPTGLSMLANYGRGSGYC